MHAQPRTQTQLIGWLLYVLIAVSLLAGVSVGAGGAATPIPSQAQQVLYLPLIRKAGVPALVFVSRQIPPDGTVYWDAPNSLPGVGPYSRFQVAASGKLLVREENGALRTLVDGANPTPASLNLIDVNAPDVSYDGTRIVFAGLTNGAYDRGPLTNPGAWRLYVIHVNGSGLRQLTFSDRILDLSQFGSNANSFRNYDDTDPAWLPDGRVVFSATRFPGFGMYGAARSSNLFVVNADGSGLHRITSEHNGADRPMVDPLTGQIVYSRWWRNFRMATNSLATVTDPNSGYKQKDGLIAANRVDEAGLGGVPGGSSNLTRNSWPLAAINPDGSGLRQFAGTSGLFEEGEIANHAYGGAFAPDGTLYANFFPMRNGTEAAGFGGIRRYTRGANGYVPVIGITTSLNQTLASQNPPSYGVYVGAYAAEPAVLPDGRLVISWAANAAQDYGLYVINADGSGRQPLYDNPGTTELRARVIAPRPLPPLLADQVTQVASPLPPPAAGPYDVDGTFTFDARNVYFNAPVDVDIANALPVGSAGTIRFFIDHARSQQTGSVEALDWPILLQELAVNPDGSIAPVASPANVPLFEQIRSPQPGYRVPLTGMRENQFSPGAGHVAGENWGRPGDVQTCVGCHAGHTLIPVPANRAEAAWTNLAPGAMVNVSSIGPYLYAYNLVNRRVRLDPSHKYWYSAAGQNATAQWVKLTFPVPITVRRVVLYNPPSEPGSNTQVQAATVKLYSDAGGTVQVASATSGPVAVTGTGVPFTDVRARVVRIEINAVSGASNGQSVAALAEIEVIARGEAGP
jgi:hypothetical protein